MDLEIAQIPFARSTSRSCLDNPASYPGFPTPFAPQIILVHLPFLHLAYDQSTSYQDGSLECFLELLIT